MPAGPANSGDDDVARAAHAAAHAVTDGDGPAGRQAGSRGRSLARTRAGKTRRCRDRRAGTHAVSRERRHCSNASSIPVPCCSRGRWHEPTIGTDARRAWCAVGRHGHITHGGDGAGRAGPAAAGGDPALLGHRAAGLPRPVGRAARRVAAGEQRAVVGSSGLRGGRRRPRGPGGGVGRRRASHAGVSRPAPRDEERGPGPLLGRER